MMRRFAAVLVVLLAFSVTAAAAQPSTQSVTATKLKTTFKAMTGDKLVPNTKFAYPGHYVAFDAGPQSIARKAKYGTFTVYLVTGADVEADVTYLLADARTGVLGTAGPGKIYWESGTTLYGDKYWLAKRRYGANVVLHWTGSNPVKKTTRSFKRLHAVLAKASG
jgi:hypothetical protein